LSSPLLSNSSAKEPHQYVAARRSRQAAARPPAATSLGPTAPAPAPQYRADLAELIATYRKWLEIPDTSYIEMTAAAYAANRLPGRAVYFLLVGPASSGKGESLGPFEYLPHTHRAAYVSEASLLSGTPKNDRSDDSTGGILREVDKDGGAGTLILKDFTSLFTLNNTEKSKALSALGQCFDGHWDRPVGADGARVLRWDGKLGLIGATTEAIDEEYEILAKLGPRIVFFRCPDSDDERDGDEAQCRRAGNDDGERETEMRVELNDAVKLFFGALDFTVAPALPDSDREWLVQLVTLATRCRAYVKRHTYTREIVQIPKAEKPARLMRSIVQLWKGLELIGVPHARRRELIQRTALDGMPPIRRLVFDHLAVRPATVRDIASTSSYPEGTIRRAVEEMQAHGLLENNGSGLWKFAGNWERKVRFLDIEGHIGEKVVGKQGSGRVPVVETGAN
jgi:hypothetical protein